MNIYPSSTEFKTRFVAIRFMESEGYFAKKNTPKMLRFATLASLL